MLIITAASENHFKSSLKLLESIQNFHPKAHVIYWDLGLVSDSRRKLKQEFPGILLRTFQFQNFPEFYSLQHGSYAWKASVVQQSIGALRHSEYFWIDAGCILESKLTRLRVITFFLGIFLFKAAGTNKQWTYPSTTCNFVNFTKYENLPQLAATLISFRGRKEIRILINQWHELCAVREIIAPHGSSKSNHRQDQSLLSNLYLEKLKNRMVARGIIKFRLNQQKFGLLFHQEID